MLKFPLASLGAVLALFACGLALFTFFRPPTTIDSRSLPVGSAQDETLDLTFSAPAWLRSGLAEDVALVLRREGIPESRAVWLASAELHAGGAVVSPSARREGPLGPGDQVAYRWSVGAGSPGLIPVEISVRMQWDETGEGEILWADGSRLQVREYLGMDAATARTAGILGSLISVITAIIGRRWKAR